MTCGVGAMPLLPPCVALRAVRLQPPRIDPFPSSLNRSPRRAAAQLPSPVLGGVMGWAPPALSAAPSPLRGACRPCRGRLRRLPGPAAAAPAARASGGACPLWIPNPLGAGRAGPGEPGGCPMRPPCRGFLRIVTTCRNKHTTPSNHSAARQQWEQITSTPAAIARGRDRHPTNQPPRAWPGFHRWRPTRIRS